MTLSPYDSYATFFALTTCLIHRCALFYGIALRQQRMSSFGRVQAQATNYGLSSTIAADASFRDF